MLYFMLKLDLNNAKYKFIIKWAKNSLYLQNADAKSCEFYLTKCGVRQEWIYCAWAGEGGGGGNSIIMIDVRNFYY
jgi:hypothetical protein